MKVYKLEVIVIDLDEIGKEEIQHVLENTHYPNHCINLRILSIKERDIGEWSDDHPLNKENMHVVEIKRLFKEKKQ